MPRRMVTLWLLWLVCCTSPPVQGQSSQDKCVRCGPGIACLVDTNPNEDRFIDSTIEVPDNATTWEQMEDPDDSNNFPSDNPDEEWRIDICSSPNPQAPQDRGPPELDDPVSIDISEEEIEAAVSQLQAAPAGLALYDDKNNTTCPETTRAKGGQYYTATAISGTEILLEWYITQWTIDQNELDACWKEKGTFTFSLCSVNSADIRPGQLDVDYLGLNGAGLHHYSRVLNQLECDTDYKVNIKGPGGFLTLFNTKVRTLACPVCAWGDSVAAFGGNYVIQTSHLEKTDESCRLHRGDFNGDGRTDILRSCNDRNYNALWWGSTGSAGFSPYGYVLTASHLQNSMNTHRLHIGDFNGDGRDDLLRSSDTPTLNALFYGAPTGWATPFIWAGYTLVGSVVENFSGTCKVHIGDYNGDGSDDLLRTCINPALNKLWYGVPGGFVLHGPVFTTTTLQNVLNTCRIHVGNFDGIDGDDILRSCDNPTYNYLIKGTPTGLVGVGPTLTGSVLEKSDGTCRLHVGNFNGDGATDIMRTCDNPFYNVVLYGGTAFTSSGYVIQTSVLEKSDDTCRLHLGDFDGDGKTDLFRSCDSRCYNAIWLATATGFNGLGYTLTTSVLETSPPKTCKLHLADYNGSGKTDMLRTCNTAFYNALFRPVL